MEIRVIINCTIPDMFLSHQHHRYPDSLLPLQSNLLVALQLFSNCPCHVNCLDYPLDPLLTETTIQGF